ncbi:MAG: M48 family metallopeptidase [Tenacibaculum sp.]|nr:M48 family metallopeptidase [Tenacibaculum sp.]
MHTHDIKKCKHPKENKLFTLGVIGTILILSLLFFGSFFRTEIIKEVKTEMIKTYKKDNPSYDKKLTEEQLIKQLSEEDKDTLNMLDYYYWFVVILAPLAFFLLVLFFIGKMYGDLRGNSVRLDENQYPEVYKIFVELATELGFEEIPELYLVNGNGTLNAYATCVPGYRNFSAIYSDILERCLKNNDMETLKFILGHELGHIRFNHVKWWYSFLTFWTNLPVIKYFVGLPMSRAREYGCDKIGEKLSGDSTGRPLMILGAGKYAYQDIDLEEYTKEHFEKPSFWVWLSNLTKDHGLTSWRIAAIRKKHHAGLIFKNKNENELE